MDEHIHFSLNKNDYFNMDENSHYIVDDNIWFIDLKIKFATLTSRLLASDSHHLYLFIQAYYLDWQKV